MIDSFSGANRWLSNFWPAAVVLDNVTYPSVEHAYQAAKTVGDRSGFVRGTAANAKYLGRKVVMRSDWNAIKLGVMRNLIAQKFQPAQPERSISANQLTAALLATGDQELVEGNYWNDTFWGVCRGRGENHLGKLLMQRRKELQ